MPDMSTQGDVPVADWFDQATMLADPYPEYARLRALGPVVHVPQINRYLLTSHASVTGAEQHPDLFSAHSSNNTMVRAVGGRPMLRKDDPEHSTERSAINPTLRPRAVGQGGHPDSGPLSSTGSTTSPRSAPKLQTSTVTSQARWPLRT